MKNGNATLNEDNSYLLFLRSRVHYMKSASAAKTVERLIHQSGKRIRESDDMELNPAYFHRRRSDREIENQLFTEFKECATEYTKNHGTPAQVEALQNAESLERMIEIVETSDFDAAHWAHFLTNLQQA